MVKQLRFKMLLLLAVLFAGVGTAWAVDAKAEFAPSDFSGQGTTSSGSAISAEVDGITFACDKGYGTTQIRCYKDGTITISSSKTIKAISFTFSGSYTGGLETSYTNLSTTKWEKTLSSQARFTKIEVTYEAKTKIATIGDLNVTTINFSEYGTFSAPITPAANISATDYTVAWGEISNDKIEVLEDGTYEAGTTKGSVEVTVTVTPIASMTSQYEAVSKKFTVKVVDPNANDGLSQAKAFTCAEAIEAINEGVDATVDYYVKGIVNTVDNFNSDNSLTYWIADDGNSKQFEIYKGFGINGADFTSATDLGAGDVVIVKGNLTKFGSTYELNSGNELVSLTTKNTPTLTFSPAALSSMAVGDPDVTLSLTTDYDGTITAASDNDKVATITSAGSNKWTIHAVGKGDVKFTFTGAATASYKAVNTSLNLSVSALTPYTLTQTLTIDNWDDVPSSYTNADGEYTWGGCTFELTKCIKQTTLQFKSGEGQFISPIINSAHGYAVIVETATGSNSNGVITLQIDGESAVTAKGAGKTIMATTTNTGAAFSIKNLSGNVMKVEKIIILPTPYVTDAGWATFITPADMTFAENTAYVVSTVDTDAGQVTMTAVTDVPANEPILLKGSGAKTISLPTSTVTKPTNLLTICGKTIDSGKNAYVLAKDDVAGACFKQWTGDVSVLEGRVVLLLNSSASRSSYDLDGEAAGISLTENGRANNDGSVYNLSGQR